MRNFVIAATIAAFAVPIATPAVAQSVYDQNDHQGRWRDGNGNWHEGHDVVRDDRSDGRRDRYSRDDRRDDRNDGRRDGYRNGNRNDRYADRDYSRPERYYRGGNQYQARRLNRDDQIYRGRDNRYYCRRNDGTTGLIVGGVGGGVLGNLIAPGGSKTLGTILGGVGGGLLGRGIDKDNGRNVTCR